MKRLPSTVALAFALIGVGVALAQAQTVVSCPQGCALPYQQWVDEAKVPTPDATEEVIETETLPCSEALGCTNGSAIYILSAITNRPGAVRGVFYHELGHDFAAVYFPELYTSERFADSYALCARGGIKPRWQLSVGEGLTTGRRLERVCRMIRRVGA